MEKQDPKYIRIPIEYRGLTVVLFKLTDKDNDFEFTEIPYEEVTKQ